MYRYVFVRKKKETEREEEERKEKKTTFFFSCRFRIRQPRKIPTRNGRIEFTRRPFPNNNKRPTYKLKRKNNLTFYNGPTEYNNGAGKKRKQQQ